ncbi:2-C-methyl-D-erythritol 4-phosphate cytidylyltransferase [Thiococcus pfennigii]|jgi:2-C-methyl-D-erythritol 4-phosphate cytidylyltransferase|uniref:2-C-methyl-D-erythritol 4-phosphate cytidylyltransferase n=1 Tax=Thiococcus pfennigii TaxID=1057 RepID=UPI001904F32A|nr:2-C-methyl-D-erythritol 4-phosphate cytidylyltransferase [Thiococcus pfennigii]MBK1700152.1 2-C-methyl-D-erythritol 4-phosphate cytidylyltransferase [Thiococcus pfennigii]MBK1731136.1 2-C-methyl-D-erythritol 4-phosphate cytidylyltransferase [Thiococcus pfennigii]
MSGGEAFWAIVPAAGVGRRVGAAIPKQYLPLAGRRVIDQGLAVLLGEARIRGVVVALDPHDALWSQTAFAEDPRVRRVAGGAERCHSVLNALEALAETAAADDWVLVHDAARPCLRADDLARMIEVLREDPVGGILAMPVRDTMKEADAAGRIGATLPRERLWHAYTPQMFRLGPLREAIAAALAAGELVTDEAAAIERVGRAPRLIEGHADNIKITRPEDLPLAEFYLQQQGRIC